MQGGDESLVQGTRRALTRGRDQNLRSGNAVLVRGQEFAGLNSKAIIHGGRLLRA